MIIALNIVLIIFLHQIYGYGTQDVEVVLLPLWNAEKLLEVPLRFRVFGQSVELTLRRNDKILAPGFQFWKHDAQGRVTQLPELSRPVSCHYLHRDRISTAALSLCQQRGLQGLVFLENVTLEITPIKHDDPFFNGHYIVERSDPFGEPHIVKRAYVSAAAAAARLQRRHAEQKGTSTKDDLPKTPAETELLTQLIRDRGDEALTLELAVFFDEPGYKLFSPFLNDDDEEMRDMLLAYVNGIQALYHHPSLGIKLDISLVRLDMMQKQPNDLPHFGGERGSLLDSFCHYASVQNPSQDDHPNHWDMGLYVSGLDFYAVESGMKNSATMGLATVGGICIPQYSCVIAELGVTNSFGKPYPSAGFTSVYIAAHEIGHNLGMHHDSTGNSCPKDGYIMSPSRGTQGETTWSDCSRDVARKLSWSKPCLHDRSNRRYDHWLDHGRFFDVPGRKWDARRQCQVLLRDKDADAATLFQACQALQCETPNRSGYYFAGPALDGTPCASGRECRGGQCLPARDIPENGVGGGENLVRPGGWSEWRDSPCSSGCLQNAKGALIRRRTCDDPPPRNTKEGCDGLHYDVLLCRDDRLCKQKRRTVGEFATMRCSQFSERLPELDGKGSGLQAPHESERPWMACAIFCRRKDIASYYTPRVELNDLGLDPYFPDGTWCHREEGQDYFCRQHHCLPENFRFAKKLPWDRVGEDAAFGPQNARPADGGKLSDSVIKYLSLGPNGLPLLTSLPAGVGSPPGEDEWIDKDYVDLPGTDENELEAIFVS